MQVTDSMGRLISELIVCRVGRKKTLLFHSLTLSGLAGVRLPHGA